MNTHKAAMLEVSSPEQSEFEELIDQINLIRDDCIRMEQTLDAYVEGLPANYRLSARNLIHYLALRSRDMRSLQLQLAHLGLSSLGRAESHVMANIDAVLKALHRLLQRDWVPPVVVSPCIDFETGNQLLAQHTQTLLGTPPAERGVHIMVTMPSEAADDYTLIHGLLKSGMNIMRINCAHDDTAAWLRMIEHLRRAEESTGRSCRIIMDLAGPKLRTGNISPGPAVVKFRPQRDAFGHIVGPARIWLTAQEFPRKPHTPADACLPVLNTWLAGLRPGTSISFTDERGARRSMTVVDVTTEGCWAEAIKTAYLTPGITLAYTPDGSTEPCETAIGDLPQRAAAISLHKRDLLIVTKNQQDGRPATYDSSGQVLSPAMASCTLPTIIDDICASEPIWFDDGKIAGVVEKKESDYIHVRITMTGAKGGKLASDKGINLPDSTLHVPALTEKDCDDLRFIVEHADMVALSFANQVEDVRMLQKRIKDLGDRRPGIVLKIETKRGFENLPSMLLSAMESSSCGVMIARGDLAVECGFERMAEVQEEILWICEAAHVPVIWATQVLESLAKGGLPSRAEITDAAMGHRAECVMLNKGPYIIDAVQMLDDIMRRMEGHQNKKSSMLRELHLASIFSEYRPQ